MTRMQWAAGHLAVTAPGIVGLFGVTGLVLGFFYGLFMGNCPERWSASRSVL
ncbi:hypothetical protein MTY414_75770 [Mycolicibacterium mageritense]|nr:hypothetical protein MTY414_75770 [Mycolicibacterium mageritense]